MDGALLCVKGGASIRRHEVPSPAQQGRALDHEVEALLAREARSLSEILSELPHLHMMKKKVICPSHKIADVLKMIRQLYADAPMDLTDGVKVTLPHGWLHVRASNTEPIIRLSAEAETEEQVQRIVESVFGLVQEAVAS